MKDTILLTGSTGFVGAQILKALLEFGLDVRVVVRCKDKIDLINSVCEIIETKDIFSADKKWWPHVFRGVNTVIHAAWYVEPGEYLDSLKNIDCMVGTLNMAKNAVHCGVKRFVGIGTCLEYQQNRRRRIRSDATLKPISLYASTKASTFMSLDALFRTCGIDFAWCRLFYLYGDGENPKRLVPYLRKSLSHGQHATISNGSKIRDFIDVRDAGRLIARVATGEITGPVNICSGNGISVRRFALQIADEYGRRDLLRFDDMPAANATEPAYIVGVKDI